MPPDNHRAIASCPGSSGATWKTRRSAASSHRQKVTTTAADHVQPLRQVPTDRRWSLPGASEGDEVTGSSTTTTDAGGAEVFN
ncbi:MAG: hypothetical protein R2697_07165 [Ilumatobacteraceae bacterium]